MKKLLIILITIPLIFNSCKKEDDSPNSGSNNTSGSIIGTWKVENYTNTMSEGYIDPVSGTEVVTYTDVDTGPVDVEEYLTFTNDNTILDHIYENDTLSSIDTMNYTKNGNEIIVYLEDLYNVTLTITQLTNTNLSYNLLNPGELTTYDDTTYFQRTTGVGNMSKSNLPLITITPLNKNKPVSGYNSFLNRRKK
tara:strand:+ start:103 stop:684 length:582 start_codon:yes stop_codon:yes gene_type:complete